MEVTRHEGSQRAAGKSTVAWSRGGGGGGGGGAKREELGMGASVSSQSPVDALLCWHRGERK